MKNYFGFDVDDDDDNDVGCSQRQSLPPVNCTMGPTKRFSKPAAKVTSPKMSTRNATLQKTSAATATTTSIFSRIPQAINSIREKVQLMRNTKPSTTVSSDVLNEPKSKTQSKISSHFGDLKLGTASSSKGTRSKINKKKITETTRTKEVSETEITTSYIDLDGLSLFDTTWPEREGVSSRKTIQIPSQIF